MKTNKTRTGGLLIALALLVSACVSATVDEPNVCSSSDLGTVPGAPVSGVAVPPQQFSTSQDLSEVLGKIGDVADNASARLTQLSLSSDNDLSWVSQVDVNVKGDSDDLPDRFLGTYRAAGSAVGNNLALDIKMDDASVQKYLNHPVTLTFTVSGTTTTQTNKLSSTLCAGASGDFSKSL